MDCSRALCDSTRVSVNLWTDDTANGIVFFVERIFDGRC